MRPTAFQGAMSAASRALVRAGVFADVVDVGGGFPSVYPGMTPPPLDDYADSIQRGFAEMMVHETTELWCEPGRALVAEASSILVKVELRKGDALYLNDGSYGNLFDAAHSKWPFPVRAVREGGHGNAPLRPFQFFGPTCDSIDHMPGPFWLPEDISEGDHIEIGPLVFEVRWETGVISQAERKTVVISSDRTVKPDDISAEAANAADVGTKVAAARAATSSSPSPPSGMSSRFSTLRSIRCAAWPSRSSEPLYTTTARTGSTDSRRSMKVRASTDRLSAHCRLSTSSATAPVPTKMAVLMDKQTSVKSDMAVPSASRRFRANGRFRNAGRSHSCRLRRGSQARGARSAQSPDQSFE